MQRFNMIDPQDDHAIPQPSFDDYWNSAWWCAVSEPADPDVHTLRSVLGDEEAIAWVKSDQLHALPSELWGSEHQVKRWTQAYERWRPRSMSANPDSDLATVHDLGGSFIIPGDARWPDDLEILADKQPWGLWVWGEVPQSRSCAIVGARASSNYGNYHAREIASELAQNNVNVISGGAFGIDIAAHRGACEAGGRTFAVMAGGLGELYPASHAHDFRTFVDSGGGIISEVPPMWRPARWRFLERNRLVAALSHVTVVIEAGLRSGALSTARQAMEMGREVAALPGMVTHEMSKGCHELLRNGATLIRHGHDIVDMMPGWNSAETQDLLFGSPVEEDQGIAALDRTQRRVWEALPRRGSMSLERLSTESGLSRQELFSALAILEIRGFIARTPHGWKRVEQ